MGKRVLITARELAESLGLFIIGQLQKPFRLGEPEEVLRNPAHQAGTARRQKPEIVIPDAELRLAIERDEFVLHLPTANRFGNR